MSLKPMENNNDITQLIARAKRRIKRNEIISAIFLLVAFGLILVFAGVIVDHIFPMNTLERFIALLIVCLVCFIIFALFIVYPLVRRLNDLYIAKLFEKAYPELDESLLNAIDLQHRPGIPPEVVQLLEDNVHQKVHRFEYDRIINKRSLKISLYVALCALIFASVYTLMSDKSVLSSVLRIFNPLSNIPAPTSTQIKETVPGNTRIIENGTLAFSARVGGRIPESVSLVYTLDNTSWNERALAAGVHDRFQWSYTWENVTLPFTYYIKANDARSAAYTVGVIPRLKIASAHWKLTYPDYAGVPPAMIDRLDIQCYKGTLGELVITPNRPVAQARINFDDRAVPLDITKAGEEEGSPQKLRKSFEIDRNMKYTVELVDEEGLSFKTDYHFILCRDDLAPQVSITKPARAESTISIDAQMLPVKMSVKDDFGLADVRLVARVNDENAVEEEIPFPQGAKEIADGAVELDLAQFNLTEYDVVRFYIEAVDNRSPKGNIGRSQEITLRTSPAQAEVAMLDEDDTALEDLAAEEKTEETPPEPGQLSKDAADIPGEEELAVPPEEEFNPDEENLEEDLTVEQLDDELTDMIAEDQDVLDKLEETLAQNEKDNEDALQDDETAQEDVDEPSEKADEQEQPDDVENDDERDDDGGILPGDESGDVEGEDSSSNDGGQNQEDSQAESDDEGESTQVDEGEAQNDDEDGVTVPGSESTGSSSHVSSADSGDEEGEKSAEGQEGSGEKSSSLGKTDKNASDESQHQSSNGTAQGKTDSSGAGVDYQTPTQSNSSGEGKSGAQASSSSAEDSESNEGGESQGSAEQSESSSEQSSSQSGSTGANPSSGSSQSVASNASGSNASQDENAAYPEETSDEPIRSEGNRGAPSGSPYRPYNLEAAGGGSSSEKLYEQDPGMKEKEKSDTERIEAVDRLITKLLTDVKTGNVDDAVLEDLGWTADDLNNFIEKYDKRLSLRRRVKLDEEVTPAGDDAEIETTEPYRGVLEMGADESAVIESVFGVSPSAIPDDELRDLFEARKEKISPLYRRIVEEYFKRLAESK